MKALFVSAHFPKDFKQSASGTYKRMRVFLDALKEKASIRLLFYYRPELEAHARRVAEVKYALQSAWGLNDVDVVLSRQAVEVPHENRLWDAYFRPTLNIHDQRGYARMSGTEQLRAFEACLDARPDVIFAHRLPAACPMLLTKRHLPPVFLDLDDVEHRVFLRDVAQPPKWRTKPLLYLQWPSFLLGERRAISLSRKTFVCSEVDQRYLSGRWRLPNVCAIPNAIRIPESQPLSDKRVLLFLGLLSYGPNTVAAEELVTKIWPRVRTACPEATLVIAGASPERLSCFSQSHPGVEYTGYVEDLDAVYQRARVVCCPIRSGGGTRIKIIEAAAYGKPIVSTHVGAEGLDFVNGREILLHDDGNVFADACIELLRNEAMCSQIGNAARAKAIERYAQDQVIRLIQNEIFGSLTHDVSRPS
jgi:glycosyltransferase involved in cell wall biosynthesis